jgi:hypothetical protein
VNDELAGHVQRLLDIEEIKKLKARYFRFMDTKQFDRLAELFTADADAWWTGPIDGDDCVIGAEAIARYISNAVLHVTTVHHGHMPEIDILGPERAHGVWPMFDALVYPENGGVRRTFTGYGHYHEDYVKQDGSWKIAKLRLSRLRADNATVTAPA